MWDGVTPLLTEQFYVLRYDGRGQGESPAPEGAYTLDALGNDVCALLDALHIQDVHFCGQAMGSLVGIWLALFARARVRKLVLANTAAAIGTRDFWDTRIAAVKDKGLASLADTIISRWFTPRYAAANTTMLHRMKQMLLRSSSSAYAGYCEAIRNADFRTLVPQISVPTLVIGGAYDAACPPQESLSVCNQIIEARYEELPAGHMSSVEEPEAFAALVKSFLIAEREEGKSRPVRRTNLTNIRGKE